MSLRDLNINIEYRTLVENITKEFYIPLLSEGVLYKRAVGFFSSSSLVELSVGLNRLIKNNGRVQLIVSPHLDEKDVEAMRMGYKMREEVIFDALYRNLKSPRNAFQEKHLNMLANLIADGILDIKVALTTNSGQYGMYHEKVGIIEDIQGNKVAFSGSMNETANAFNSNYETIDVYTSWSNDSVRVEKKEKAFDAIWNNEAANLKTIDLPELKDEIVKRYKTKSIDYQSEFEDPEYDDAERLYSFFRIPDDITLYDYQKDAIEKWFDNDCCGVYDMATGTGKTYTALASISKLSQFLNENIAIIIVVPYQHLVEQWAEDLLRFNVNPIIAYSGYNWREAFSDAVRGYNLGAIDNFCIITTTASFIIDDFQLILNRLRRNYCFVADEAHNMGANSVSELLPLKARYRLALSATLERYGDAEGTEKLYRYFGNKCIQFTLDEAISKGFLTTYYYYPILVTLNDEELQRYQELSEKIRRVYISKHDPDDEVYKSLIMKRARIVAGCHSKVDKLLEVISKYKRDNNILVYCGATKYNSENPNDDDIKQIEEVSSRLYFDLGMKVRKFTSFENQKERAEIKKMFIDGDIQVITAIKCLDEGVNIPAIKTAFILASSTNPKEYIQRRGRVLRVFPGKEFAEIYDFITLPRELNQVRYCSGEELEFDYSLVKREFSRMIDFARTARNPFDIDSIRREIIETYNIDDNGGYDYGSEQ